MDRGAWWVMVHGVTKSQTQLSDWVRPRWQPLATCCCVHWKCGQSKIQRILKTWYAKRNVKHLIYNFYISYILKLYFRYGIIITSTCFFLLILMWLTESFKSHVWFTLCFYWTSQVWQFVKGRLKLHPQNIKYKSQINKFNENKMERKYV